MPLKLNLVLFIWLGRRFRTTALAKTRRQARKLYPDGVSNSMLKEGCRLTLRVGCGLCPLGLHWLLAWHAARTEML